ncbi:hypothetical protein OAQ37_00135 [Alphaproteobacteria bacterium]|nr:hypothetical protein [Alphaproteobacteria bacterium]
MLQDSASPQSIDEKRAALADAAWALLVTHDIDKISLDMVADVAGIENGLAGALGGSVQRLVLAKMAALDHQSVMESFDDIEDAGEVSIREKIIEGLLHRFETYAPYRAQIGQLNRSVRRHPELALRLLDGLEAVVRRILVMAGDPVHGLKGVLRVKGVVAVFLATARVWMKDDSPDLVTTMKMLDQRMTRAEEWGVSLGLFGSKYGCHADQNHHDDVSAG